MSLLIHILQQDDTIDTIESVIIDGLDITELSCTHPLIKNEENQEEEIEISNDQEKPISHLEFVYTNGERKHLTTSSKTAFRILNEDGVILETTDPQKFEEVLLFSIAQHGVNFEEGEDGEDG